MADDKVFQKRRVTMTSVVAVPVDDLFPDGLAQHQAVDYVPPALVEAYVADARNRWQRVEVSDEHDAGPGGEGAPFAVPGHLDHPLAGQTLTEDPEV